MMQLEGSCVSPSLPSQPHGNGKEEGGTQGSQPHKSPGDCRSCFRVRFRQDVRNSDVQQEPGEEPQREDQPGSRPLEVKSSWWFLASS